MRDDAGQDRPSLAAVVVYLAGFLFGLLGLVILSLSIYSNVKTARAFPLRHVEATDFIEWAYAERQANGRWPSAAEFEDASRELLPDDWSSEGDPARGGPVVYLHGPDHMILSYRFSVSQKGEASKRWRLSGEGSTSFFEANVDY